MPVVVEPSSGHSSFFIPSQNEGAQSKRFLELNLSSVSVMIVYLPKNSYLLSMTSLRTVAGDGFEL